MDKQNIRVTIETPYGIFYAATDIDAVLREEWEPLRTTDDVMLAIANSEVMIDSGEVRRIVKLRKDAAEDIARVVTGRIIEAMSNRDTHNGYSV